MANSSITVPTVNGTMEAAQHIGDFQIEVPSEVASGLAILGISLANGLEDEVRRSTQSRSNTDREPTPRQGHFFDRDDDDGPEL